MSKVRIGNTYVAMISSYRGYPFSTMRRNSDVLVRVFPQGKLEPVSDEKSDKGTAIVLPDSGENNPAGHPVRCAVTSDSIRIEHLFPPQTIEDLSRHISSPREELDKVTEALVSAYQFPNEPRRFGAKWNAATDGVPCIQWLRQQCQLKPGDLDLSAFVEQGASIDWRPVGTRVVVHLLPPGTADLQEELKSDLQTLSLIEVDCQSSEAWRNGLATVNVRLHGIRPEMYPALLSKIV